MSDNDGGALIPDALVEDFWVFSAAENPFFAPMTPAEEAELIRRYNRPHRRFLRWMEGWRWAVHDWLFPDCLGDDS